jgi:hypothetical protein
VRLLGRMLLGSVRDLAPVVLVILFFHVVVLQRPLGELAVLIQGALLVVVGLTLFVYGLELALFPMGEALAFALAKRGSFLWLLAFAFLLGFGTTLAEPALTAIASEAAEVASESGVIDGTDEARERYRLGLRLTVALGVGVALVLGVSRIVTGWPLKAIVTGGYVSVIALSLAAPPEAIGIAYDAGGVTTSVITVPLVTALGIGLASSLGGRNPMTDGFGMIALALLTPMVFVMLYGMFVSWT